MGRKVYDVGEVPKVSRKYRWVIPEVNYSICPSSSEVNLCQCVFLKEEPIAL